MPRRLGGPKRSRISAKSHRPLTTDYRPSCGVDDHARPRDSRPVTVAVIPCHNEAAAIGRVVTGLRPWVDAVLVVDDGSTDGTARLAGTAGARVLRQETTGGKGAALRRGWEEAARLGAEAVLLLDGDGQHDPADAPRFLEARRTSGADLVIGNRFHAGAPGMPFVRRRTNLWMSRRLSRLAGLELPDTQCGYRLARVSALMAAGLQTCHFEIESEMVLAFARAGRRMEFVPLTPRYGAERSKIRPWLDSLRWVRWYLTTAPHPPPGHPPG